MSIMSRFWARLCVILVAVFCAGLLLTCLLPRPWMIALDILSLAGFLCVKFLALRCPRCGWGGAVPQWSRSGTLHCPKCGGLLEYDR